MKPQEMRKEKSISGLGGESVKKKPLVGRP